LSHRTLNQASYNAIADRWDAARRSFFGREREYVDALLDGLPRASAVLDLGCGTGRPIAEYILSKGHRIVGVDQAEKPLAIAQQRYPSATWIRSSIQAYVPATRFNAVVCWDAMFHIERSEHEGLFARFAEMLLPGGRLMVTIGGSEHPAFTDTMFGETFFYDSHPPGKTLEILTGIGLEPVISEFLNEPVAGKDKGRYAIVARRA
jgi:trans-aconitate methyltransferase